MKRAYYDFMYDLTNTIMWIMPYEEAHFNHWFKVSERYRNKRDAVA